MQHFSFIVVNFNICRQVNKPETVTVSHQAPVKKRKPTVNAICDYQNRGHLVLVRQGIEPKPSTPPSGTYTQPTELTRLYNALYTDWKNLEEKLNSHQQQQYEKNH